MTGRRRLRPCCAPLAAYRQLENGPGGVLAEEALARPDHDGVHHEVVLIGLAEAAARRSR